MTPIELEPRVLYVAGLAHSGSTYLSRVLNQHSRIHAAGEMVNLGEEADLPPSRLACACRRVEEHREECDFWPGVLDSLRDRGVDPKRTARLSGDRRLEWIRACAGRYPEGGREAFRRNNALLYNELARRTGCDVLLDSSKTLWRLVPLARCYPGKIRVLHLIKRPANQMQSRLKRDYNFWHSLLLKYVRKNYLLQRMFRGDASYRRLPFEQLVESPRTVLGDLLGWLDLEFEELFEKPQKTTHHLRGHLEAYRPGGPPPPPNPKRLRDQPHDFNLLQRVALRATSSAFRYPDRSRLTS